MNLSNDKDSKKSVRTQNLPPYLNDPSVVLRVNTNDYTFNAGRMDILYEIDYKYTRQVLIYKLRI